MKIRIRLKSCDGGYIVSSVDYGDCNMSIAVRIANLYEMSVKNPLIITDKMIYRGADVSNFARQIRQIGSQATIEQNKESSMDMALRLYYS